MHFVQIPLLEKKTLEKQNSTWEINQITLSRGAFTILRQMYCLCRIWQKNKNRLVDQKQKNNNYNHTNFEIKIFHCNKCPTKNAILK